MSFRYPRRWNSECCLVNVNKVDQYTGLYGIMISPRFFARFRNARNKETGGQICSRNASKLIVIIMTVGYGGAVPAKRRRKHKGRHAAASDGERFSVAPPECFLRLKLKKERSAFYEVNQAPVSRGPGAGGTFGRRLGTNLNPTGSKEEAQARSNGASAADGNGCRRSGVERRPGRPAAANPATGPATAAGAAELAASAGRRGRRRQPGQCRSDPGQSTAESSGRIAG